MNWWYGLLLGVLAKAESISLFARDSLRTYCAAEKNALYDALNREDWNGGACTWTWRGRRNAGCGSAAGCGRSYSMIRFGPGSARRCPAPPLTSTMRHQVSTLDGVKN